MSYGEDCFRTIQVAVSTAGQEPSFSGRGASGECPFAMIAAYQLVGFLDKDGMRPLLRPDEKETDGWVTVEGYEARLKFVYNNEAKLQRVVFDNVTATTAWEIARNVGRAADTRKPFSFHLNTTIHHPRRLPDRTSRFE